MTREPLEKCPECGFVKHSESFECAICAIQADHLEHELKRWIAARYRAKAAQR